MWTFIIVGGSNLDFFLKISIKFKFRCIFILDMNIYSVNIPFLILDFPSRVFFLCSFPFTTPHPQQTLLAISLERENIGIALVQSCTHRTKCRKDWYPQNSMARYAWSKLYSFGTYQWNSH